MRNDTQVVIAVAYTIAVVMAGVATALILRSTREKQPRPAQAEPGGRGGGDRERRHRDWTHATKLLSGREADQVAAFVAKSVGGGGGSP